ncbi:MAG: hypothetical protein K1566_18985 [Candidatus Thiodiazotropha sp. (ex. Lucinisca nassula)]|nr:hypothetical protein [Candidatus Thiodiazotropha sp. (ex. Lucinisca nassula)]
MKHNLLWIAVTISALLSGCIAAKKVSLIQPDGHVYQGTLTYDGPYSGDLVIDNGPNNIKYTGRFVVVDKTSINKKQGSVIVPQVSNLPAVGSTSSTSSGNIDAQGYWYAAGSDGSHMKCILSIGAGGHGHGTCTHENDSKYEIML